MADFTITITVSSRVGSATTVWERTAVIADMEGMVYRNTNIQVNNTFSSESGAIGGAGIYSFTGLNAVVVVGQGAGGVFQISPRSSAGASMGDPIMASGVPFLMYGGAGTGFTGAGKTSAVGTDVPTVDLDGFALSLYAGNGTFTALAGLAPIS